MSLVCDECGSNLAVGSHQPSCRHSWPKRGRRFEHATQTWVPYPGAADEPVVCEITRVVHQSCVWYRARGHRYAIPYAEFESILGKWLS